MTIHIPIGLSKQPTEETLKELIRVYSQDEISSFFFAKGYNHYKLNNVLWRLKQGKPVAFLMPIENKFANAERKTPPKQEKIKTWMGTNPKTCSACNQPLQVEFIDGRTKSGTWGKFCLTCHAKVGDGKGQKYKLVPEGTQVGIDNATQPHRPIQPSSYRITPRNSGTAATGSQDAQHSQDQK